MVKDKSKGLHVGRRVLLAGAAGISTFAILKHPVRAAPVTYKLGHDNPVDHPVNIRAVEAADKIAKESNGQLIVKVFPNNQLGDDTQMLSQLRTGALEFLLLGDNILANVVPSANLAALPFAFNGYQDVWTTLDGDLGRYIHDQITKHTGLHVFDKGWDVGFRNVFTSNRAVHTAADMAGLKLRVPQAPVQLAFFRALGSSPTPVNNSELYTALQTHLVDGAEQPLISIETARYFEISRYVIMTLHQPTPWEMLANGPAWHRLSPDLQAIVTRVFNETALLERRDLAEGDTGLEARLKTQNQTFIEPDRESFKDVVRKAGLYQQWRDAYGAEPFALLEKSVGKLT